MSSSVRTSAVSGTDVTQPRDELLRELIPQQRRPPGPAHRPHGRGGRPQRPGSGSHRRPGPVRWLASAELRLSRPSFGLLVASRRRLLTGLLIAALLLILGGALVGRHAVRTERAANAAATAGTELQAAFTAGDTDAARTALLEMQQATARARRETSGPLWRTLAAVPYLGRNLRVGGGLAAAGDELAGRGLAPLVDVAGTLQPTSFVRADGSLDLVPLRNAEGALTAAATSLGQVRAEVAALPSSGLLGPVSSARSSLLQTLDSMLPSVRNGSIAARVAPAMLGTDGDRRYVVGLRVPTANGPGQGALRGYVVLDVAAGRLQLEKAGSRPHAGAIDGTIDLDPSSLAALLQPVGSVTLPEGSVTPDTVGEILQPAATPLRPSFAQDLLSATLTAELTSPTTWSTDLLHALGAAAGAGHLTLTSVHPEEQAVLAGTPLARR